MELPQTQIVFSVIITPKEKFWNKKKLSADLLHPIFLFFLLVLTVISRWFRNKLFSLFRSKEWKRPKNKMCHNQVMWSAIITYYIVAVYCFVFFFFFFFFSNVVYVFSFFFSKWSSIEFWMNKKMNFTNFVFFFFFLWSETQIEINIVLKCEKLFFSIQQIITLVGLFFV